MFFWEDWYTYAIVGVVALIVLIAFFRNYVKVPPNVALIVSGRRHKYKVKDESGRDVVKVFGYRIVRGGATFIIPFFERVDKLNLGIMQVDIKTTQPRAQPGVHRHDGGRRGQYQNRQRRCIRGHGRRSSSWAGSRRTSPRWPCRCWKATCVRSSAG